VTIAKNRLPEDPPFAFTNVPAELRERIIQELKARPEFTKVFEAAVHGSGVTLSLTMPEPVEFAYDGYCFTAFAWMGEIYIGGQREFPPASSERARA